MKDRSDLCRLPQLAMCQNDSTRLWYRLLFLLAMKVEFLMPSVESVPQIQLKLASVIIVQASVSALLAADQNLFKEGGWLKEQVHAH